MLIDSAHPEETRVVVTRGNRIEEFDFESASRLPLRGNIYLAKVTRVEPSLQAAFVDFGGNRHGFLAFAEIHPDYYQIPVADRMALLAEEAEAARDEDEEDERGRNRRNKRGGNRPKRGPRNEQVSEAADADAAEGAVAEAVSDAEGTSESQDIAADATVIEQQDGTADGESGDAEPREDDADAREEDEVVEQLGGGGDAMEEVPQRSQRRPRKQYKIQEVIKRRQILLVQVVKEERGNKGAALTTYLSLAGRYSVLMPNTARGGGISRKITNASDRKRLKELASDLEVPEGMGVILRTAGASRTKPEIKRDFEYLMRLWESVRTLTLESTAPALVYEEGSLIKRAIRDLYSKDIEEIHVSGDNGYREAKDFMRMLMPSHAKVVQPHKDVTPLFTRFGVEAQLDAMFSNVVTLKSGGYIVINQTEALVSIDVNSGRSTREHNIEDTALSTNLEAAEEISRQLRLRDLAGLIVIDFIDMEEKRNNRAVERKLNDCLKNDRARIQVGRISHFGLLEMSRQRIRTGVLESSTTPCPHCNGTGLLRSTTSLALLELRALEEALIKNATHDIILRTRMETAFYLLNQKRESLRALEARFGVTITVTADAALPPGQHYVIERGGEATRRFLADSPAAEGAAPAAAPPRANGSHRAVHLEDVELPEEPEEEIEAEGETSEEDGGDESQRSENGEGRKRRRRRRRRGGRDRDRENGGAPAGQPRLADANGDTAEGEAEDGDDEESGDDDGNAPRNEQQGSAEERRRRRRRRGGRRNRRDRDGREPREGMIEGVGEAAASEAADVVTTEPVVASEPEPALPADAPAKPRRGRGKKAEVEAAPAEAVVAEAEPAVGSAKPKRGRGKKAASDEVAAEVTPAPEAANTPDAAPAKPARGRRKAAPAEDVVAAEPAAPTPVVVTEAPAPAPVTPPAPAAPPPAPEPEEVVDPNRPKRSGWWAKAKSAFGG
jgi:ribonuclease E